METTTSIHEELPEAASRVTVDAMMAAAGYLSRNWGDYGYRIGLAASVGSGGVFSCSASDGSRFWIYADRWGNCRQVESWEDVERCVQD